MTNIVVGIISRKNEAGQTEYLLVTSRADFGEYSGLYYPPGGRVEAGESEQQALEREIYEELALIVNPVRKIAETPGDIPGLLVHWWECITQNYNYTIDPEEISDVGFFTEEAMRKMSVFPATQAFFKTHIFKK